MTVQAMILLNTEALKMHSRGLKIKTEHYNMNSPILTLNAFYHLLYLTTGSAILSL